RQAAVRNVLRVVDGLPLLAPGVMPVAYGVGFLAAACDGENRRLGDVAAGALGGYAEGRGGGARRPEPARGGGRATGVGGGRRGGGGGREGRGGGRRRGVRALGRRRDERGVRGGAGLFGVGAEHLRPGLGAAPREYESDEKFVLRGAALLSAPPREGPAIRSR